MVLKKIFQIARNVTLNVFYFSFVMLAILSVHTCSVREHGTHEERVWWFGESAAHRMEIENENRRNKHTKQ